MSIIKTLACANILSCFAVFFPVAYANEALGCQIVNDAQFKATTPSILAQTATVNSKVSVVDASQVLVDCVAPSMLSISYQMHLQSDLSAEQTLQMGGKSFYKIRAINGQRSGSEALNYLIDHAYIAFSINSMNHIVPIRVSQDIEQVNVLESEQVVMNTDHFSFSPYLLDVEFYFDALPSNDEIVVQLNAMPIQLNLGQLNIQQRSIDLQDQWIPSTSPQLYLNLTGIQFQRATCYVKDQTVLMEDLSVSAFHHAGSMLAGNSQAFYLDVQCDGYLNQRTINLTWKDNNWLENINRFGYLSSVKADGYSNVGIQIRDELNQPIVIGERYEFADTIQGNATSKRYVAQYLLMDSKAFVGRVNAQATIQIDYR